MLDAQFKRHSTQASRLTQKVSAALNLSNNKGKGKGKGKTKDKNPNKAT